MTISINFHISLVTQPMLQCRPNHTELILMDSYIQILCRFQKCKRKVRSILNITNKPYQFPFIVTFTTIGFFKPKGKNLIKNFDPIFLFITGGGTFRLHFWNLHKIWI